MESGEFRYRNLPAPPFGASFEKRPGGFVVTASTVDSTARLPIGVLLLLAGVVGGGVYGVGLVMGEWLESLMELPLLAGSLLAGWQGMMRAWGRISVERDGAEGRIRQGAGWLVITRRFQWVDVWTAEEAAIANFKRIALKRHAGDIRFGGVVERGGAGVFDCGDSGRVAGVIRGGVCT